MNVTNLPILSLILFLLYACSPNTYVQYDFMDYKKIELDNICRQKALACLADNYNSTKLYYRSAQKDTQGEIWVLFHKDSTGNSHTPGEKVIIILDSLCNIKSHHYKR